MMMTGKNDLSGEEMRELYQKKFLVFDELKRIKGHPLYTFHQENEELSKLLDGIGEGEVTGDLVKKISEVSIHYAKKGDLLYPLLKTTYEVAGPSDLMWTHDDEIRDELSDLSKQEVHDEDRTVRFPAVIKRIKDMIYKDERILFPACAITFTEEEWIGIYFDSKDYAECFGVKNETWETAESKKESFMNHGGGEDLIFAGGHMTMNQLEALLNTIPMEITFIDHEDINRFFNEGPKVFKRPKMAIDREVYSCHPPKVEPAVRTIIRDFKGGTRDRVPIWMEKNGRTILVTYMAVRDRAGRYLGTVELVQDMEFAREHFSK